MKNSESGQKAIIIEPHYLPSLEFFCAIRRFDQIKLEVHAHFVKQTYRSRSQINTASGPHILTIPISGRKNHMPEFEARIDYHSPWIINHLRTITSAYKNSPYYEHYFPELEQVLNHRHQFLLDLNLELLTLCLKWLGWEKEIKTTDYYQSEPEEFDFRDLLKAKDNYLTRTIYKPVPYQQVFGQAFAGNLSLIDLICCCGPQASLILQQSDICEIDN